MTISRINRSPIDQLTIFKSNEDNNAVEFLYSRNKLTANMFLALIGPGTNYAKKVLNGLCRKNIL